jgi:hypothetical protein
MGKDTILDIIKDKIGKVSWNLFLWSIDRTAEQYWNDIYEQEKHYQDLNN